jgi:opacity protein-like surface antigen
MEIRKKLRVGGFLFSAIFIFDAAANEAVEIRPYLDLRLGRSVFTGADEGAELSLDSPSGQPAFGLSFGTDIGNYLGLELAFDYTKTDLFQSSGVKAGDYSLATVLAQARFRYPLQNHRLVPYALAGGGFGLGEFSGREDFSFFGGGDDTVALGAFGAGVEYFVADNITLGVEAKYYYPFEPDVRLNNGLRTGLDASNIGVTAGMRIYPDSLGAGRIHSRVTPPAKDSDAMRGYIAVRVGEALFTNPKAVSNLDIENPSGILGNMAIGVNFNKYLGIELASEYTRAQLTSAVGDVSGYPVWTITALGRLRYPILEDRLTPYLVAGGGVGLGEGGDLDQPIAVTGFIADQESSVVGVVGSGVEYFLESNVALSFEVKYTASFDTRIRLNREEVFLSPEFVSFSGGLRIFFP